MEELIDKIPPDVDVEMTEDLIRAFRICECDPACHCCGVKIEAGTKFRLAHIKSHGHFTVSYAANKKYKNKSEQDEMLCENCTEYDLIEYKKNLWEQSSRAFDNRHNGYTRAHKKEAL